VLCELELELRSGEMIVLNSVISGFRQLKTNCSKLLHWWQSDLGLLHAMTIYERMGATSKQLRIVSRSTSCPKAARLSTWPPSYAHFAAHIYAMGVGRKVRLYGR